MAAAHLNFHYFQEVVTQKLYIAESKFFFPLFPALNVYILSHAFQENPSISKKRLY